jgi:hypothetical protein
VLEQKRKSRQGVEQYIRMREEGGTDCDGLGTGKELGSTDICQGGPKCSESSFKTILF